MLGFYKGLGFPLLTVPIVNAVIFSSYQIANKFADKYSDSEESFLLGICSGGFAGLVNCIVVTPVELVKCRLQLQLESKSKAYYNGMVDCIVKTIRQEGLTGLYRGNIATLFREIPAYAG